MKKLVMAVMVILAIVSFASFTFADDVEVGLENTLNTDIDVEGGNAEQDQNQTMEQWEQQWQNACATGGEGGKGGESNSTSTSGANITDSGNSSSAIKDSGNSTVKVGDTTSKVGDTTSKSIVGDTTATNKTDVNGVKGEIKNTYNNINKRNQITAQPGVSGSFVGAPMIQPSKDWQLFTCQPFFKSFTNEELRVMSKGAGGFFSSGIQKSMRIEEVESYDESTIVRLDWIPFGPNDKVLGEFEYQADEPMPLGNALSHVLLQAKKETNTHRVVVWIRIKGIAKNSGFSIGSGAGAARLWGPDMDATAGALAIGGLIGTTSAYVEEEWAIRVLALNDGEINPPAGVEVCGLTVSAPTSQVEVQEEEIEPACDPQPIISRIKQLEEGTKNCPTDCLNNEMLRKQMGDAYLDLFYCTGDKDALVKAIAEYKKAEKNFLEGREPNGTRTSTLQGAQDILYKAHYNSALAILELSGPDAETSFAQFEKLGKRGDGLMPENKNDIKR